MEICQNIVIVLSCWRVLAICTKISAAPLQCHILQPALLGHWHFHHHRIITLIIIIFYDGRFMGSFQYLKPVPACELELGLVFGWRAGVSGWKQVMMVGVEVGIVALGIVAVCIVVGIAGIVGKEANVLCLVLQVTRLARFCLASSRMLGYEWRA